MTLIFDIPKHLVKRKPTPECDDFEANKTKVPTPKVPTPKTTAAECDDFEASISDAEEFEKTLLDETPQTPPNSPDVSKRAKRKGKHKKGTPKRSKRLINKSSTMNVSR